MVEGASPGIPKEDRKMTGTLQESSEQARPPYRLSAGARGHVDGALDVVGLEGKARWYM